jgi:hypothetical protein
MFCFVLRRELAGGVVRQSEHSGPADHTLVGRELAIDFLPYYRRSRSCRRKLLVPRGS